MVVLRRWVFLMSEVPPVLHEGAPGGLPPHDPRNLISIDLQAKARIRPWLSYMCRVHSTAKGSGDPLCSPRRAYALTPPKVDDLWYTDTSPIRKHPTLGPYRRPYGAHRGGGVFVLSRYPCTHNRETLPKVTMRGIHNRKTAFRQLKPGRMRGR